MTSKVMENLSKMVHKSSQNTSKIDLKGGLEAAWEPPLRRGDPKTSFWRFWLHLGAPFGDQFWLIWASFFGVFLICLLDGIFCRCGVHFGPIWGAFFGTFLEACSNLPVKLDMHENISVYYGLAMSEPLEH